MSRDTREGDLEDLFGKYGRVEKVVIIRDKYTGESRRFAFIYMAEVEDASVARDAINGTVHLFPSNLIRV